MDIKEKSFFSNELILYETFWAVAKCDTYTCPEDFTQKFGAQEIECAGTTCGADDIYTCCEGKSSFKFILHTQKNWFFEMIVQS